MDSILQFLGRLPQASPDATDACISGSNLTKKIISSAEVMEQIAEYVTRITTADPYTTLNLNIWPGPMQKYGMYIDIDVVIARNEELSDGSMKSREVAAYAMNMRDILSRFCNLYIAELLSIDRARKRATSKPIVTFRKTALALQTCRPHVTQLTKPADVVSTSSDEASTSNPHENVYTYKYGGHMYVGDIIADQKAHLLAFANVVRWVGSEAANNDRIVKIATDNYGINRCDVAKIFDDNINKQRNILVPGCRKHDGKATYFAATIINHLITRTVAADTIVSSEDYAAYDGEHLRPFFPIHNGRKVIEIEGIADGEEIVMPSIPLHQNDYEAMLSEANRVHWSIGRTLELLNLIPADHIVHPVNGHEYRLKLTNAVVHSIADREQRKMWGEMLIHWKYESIRTETHDEAQLSKRGALEWKGYRHIAQKIDEAINAGPRVSRHFVEVEARKASAQAVDEICSRYAKFSVEILLKILYRMDAELDERTSIASQDIADVIYECIGHNYLVIVDGRYYDWYRYNDSPSPRASCKKWEHVRSIDVTLTNDIRHIVIPLISSLIADDDRNRMSSMFMTGTARKTYKQYLLKFRFALKSGTNSNAILIQFAARYLDTASDFISRLDREPNYTGCLNGIIHIIPRPYSIELLADDNRAIPVSRSVNARYRTDFADDHPAVCRVMDLFSKVISEKDELDYFLTIAAAIILSGHLFHKFFIIYGTGGDGKSTIMNALIATAGLVDGSFQGYGVEGDPRLFQQEKFDANSHDAASIHMFGGPRIGSFPEPDSQRPQLVESTIKSHLSGSSQMRRDINKGSRCVDFRVSPFVLVNGQLEFRGSTSDGGYRRIVVMIFRNKFKSNASEYKRPAGSKCRFFPADPEALTMFTFGPNALEMREALLWILITKYLPIFYTEYEADIDKIRVPAQYIEFTASYFGKHARVIEAFVRDCMIEVANSEVFMSEFIIEFTAWHSRTQPGSILDTRQRQSPSTSQQHVRAPWELEILNMLSSSAFCSNVKLISGGMKVDISPSEIPIKNITTLVIDGYRMKEKSR